MVVSSDSPTTIRYSHLDFIKGICILLVVLTHWHWSDYQLKQFYFPFLVDMAVPVFMVITGYVYALSFNRSNSDMLHYYKSINLAKKFIRYVNPFIPTLLVEYTILLLIHSTSFSFSNLIELFLVGGVGPGSYYVPVMFQTVIIIPIICVLIKKQRIIGLIICFFVNLFYEYFKFQIGLSQAAYRLIALRYIFILAYGVFLFYTKDSTLHACHFVAGFAGVAYIILVNYLGYRPIITSMWTTTCLFSCLYIVPVMKVLISCETIGYKCKLVQAIGRASYHIFLVQKLYYSFISFLIYKFIRWDALQIIISMIVCTVGGVCFYSAELWFRSFIVKRRLVI